MPASLEVRSLNYGDPLNTKAPLNRGLTGWWCRLPLSSGGFLGRDLTGRFDATVYQLGLSEATRGWGSTRRPGGWGEVRHDGSTGYVYQGASGLLTSTWFAALAGTMAVWLLPTAAAPSFSSSWNGRGALIDAGGNFGLVQLNLSGTNDRLWAFNYTSSTDNRVGVTYTMNEWVHLAWVHSGSTLLLYKNGRLGGTASSGTISLASHLYFGQGYSSNPSWQGAMDDIRFYNRALSASEVAALYNATCQGYPQELTWQVWPPAWGVAGLAGAGIVRQMMQHAA